LFGWSALRARREPGGAPERQRRTELPATSWQTFRQTLDLEKWRE
jgi:hypothetical protein